MNATLTGSQLLTVTFELAPDAAPGTPPRTEDIHVRQIIIRDRDEGLKHFNDEIALVAFLVGKPRAFALELTNESYEEILRVGRAINENGFFAFCQRRMDAQQQTEMRAALALAQLPEDARKVILAAGAAAMNSTASPASSSPPPPRPR